MIVIIEGDICRNFCLKKSGGAMAFKRMAKYLAEAHLHMERLMDVLERIKIFYLLNVDKFDKLTSHQKDMLDALAFRFMKLQDLLGSKILQFF